MHDRVCPECDAVFSPRYGSQVCCSDECKRARHHRLEREHRRKFMNKDAEAMHHLRVGDRKEQLKRQAERRNRFRLRDLEHKALGVPVKVTVDHRGIRREIRGHCAGGGLPAFGSLRDSRVLNLGF